MNPWKTCRRGGESGFADGNDKHGAHSESVGQSVAALVGGSPRPSSPFTTVHTDRGEEREGDGRLGREGKEICSITTDRATPALGGWEKSKHSTYTGKCFGGLSPCALMALAAASVGST